MRVDVQDLVNSRRPVVVCNSDAFGNSETDSATNRERIAVLPWRQFSASACEEQGTVTVLFSQCSSQPSSMFA